MGVGGRYYSGIEMMRKAEPDSLHIVMIGLMYHPSPVKFYIENKRLYHAVMGLPQGLGSGRDRRRRGWIVGRSELLSEIRTEGAIVDGATNLKPHRSSPPSQSGPRVHSRSKNRRENTPFGAYTPKLAAVPAGHLLRVRLTERAVCLADCASAAHFRLRG
jgi:hypothetical protein